MTSWHSYGSIYNLGHKAVEDLFSSPVTIEEKVDGSQFSFGLFDGDSGLFLRCRSKGAELNMIAPEKMFSKGIKTVERLRDEGLLHVGWTYRGEFLQSPKHNSLTYDRAPKDNIIIFDIATDEESYLSRAEKEAEVERLGLEVVPVVLMGMVDNVEVIRGLLDRTSILGGQKIEGVVIKNYAKFGPDKKTLMGKFVSEAFKEVHANEWKESNPTSGDIILRLVEKYKTPARWAKAVQHIRESGELKDSPQDIGYLIREVAIDVAKEEELAIRDALFAFAWPKIARGIVSGLPEWYKEQLLSRQFEKDAE